MRQKLIYIGIIIAAIILTIFTTLPTNAAIPYDRDAARVEACTNTSDDGNFYGDPDDPTLNRYSPTYIAHVMDAGGISINGGDPMDVISYSQIQQWMIDNPDDWEFVPPAELEAGDFALFSPQANVDENNWQPFPTYYFEHGAVYLGTSCVQSAATGRFATWNNERLNITLAEIETSGWGGGNPILSRLYVHIIDNEPPNAPTYISPLNGATFVSVDIPIEWNVATDPDGDVVRYDVRFMKNPDASGATTPTYTQLTLHEVDYASTTFTPPDEASPRGGLLPNTSYCYHITSVDTHDEENISAPVACFRTTYVRAPDNLRSVGSTLSTIDLAWSYDTTIPPAIADQFEIEYSLDGSSWSAISPLQTDHPAPIAERNITHIGLNCDQFVYYYRVRAYRAADNLYSVYSPQLLTNTRVCSFEAPLLLSPEDGTQFLNSDSVPVFQWIAANLPDTYELVIRNRNGNVIYRSHPFSEATYCSDSIGICTILDPSTLPNPLTSLPDNAEFTWEIIGSYLSRSEPSLRRQFSRSAYYTPTPIAPIGEINDGRGEITYEWTSVPDAEGYILTIYNSNGSRRGQPLSVPASACVGGICSYRPSDDNPDTYLLRNGTYRWQVESTGPTGTSLPSERVVFSLNVPSVGLVDMISPDGDALTEGTPTFTWLPVPHANEYQIQIRIGTSIIKNLTDIYHSVYCSEILCEYTLPDNDTLRSNANYTWRARVFNSPSGNGTFNEVLPFSVTIGAPGIVTLISPEPDEVLYDPFVVFQWDETTDVAMYQLRIRFPGGWRSFNVPTTNCVAGICSSTAIELPEDRTMNWEVRAINPEGTTTSERRTFTTDFMPDTIELIAPDNDDTVLTANPVFTWDDDDLGRIENYRVQIQLGTTPFYNNNPQLLAVDVCSGGTCQFDMATVEEMIDSNRRFRWRVIGTREGVNQQASSDWYYFDADVVPPRPVLTDPIGYDDVTTLTPTLLWEADERYIRFDIVIHFNNNNQLIVSIPNQLAADMCTAGSCTLDIGTVGEQLTREGVMKWRVTGYTVDGLTQNSTFDYFRAKDLLPDTIELQYPDNNYSTSDSNPEFIWVHDARLDSYIFNLIYPNGTSVFATPFTVLATSCTATCTVDLSDYAESLDKIGRYSWQVTGAIDNFIPTVTSPRRYITLENLLPNRIQLVYPRNQFTVRTRTPIFEWQDDTRIEEYKITILNRDDSTHFESDWLPSDSTLCPSDNCFFDLADAIPLQSENRYDWYVTGRRADFAGTVTSNTWWFRLNYAEPAIELVSPVVNRIFNGAAETPVFQWEDDGTYDNFTIALYNENRPMGEPIAVDTSFCTGGLCTFDMAANGEVVAEEGNFLYWRIYGYIDGYNGQGQSSRRRFQIRNVLLNVAPEPISPTNNTIIYHPATTTFEWIDTGFDAYQLIIRENAITLHDIPVDRTHCSAGICSIQNTTFPFIRARHNQTFWAVQGVTDGMNPDTSNRSVWIRLRQHLMPITSEIQSIAPRHNPVQRINTSFQWDADNVLEADFDGSHSRVDEWQLEVRDGNGLIAGPIPVDPTIDCSAIKCSYQFSNDDIQYERNNRTYRWRWRATREFLDKNGNTVTLTQVGDWVSYTVDFIPDVPILEVPAQNTTVNITQSFTFVGDQSHRASEYEIRLFDADGNRISTNNNFYHADTVGENIGICDVVTIEPDDPDDATQYVLKCFVPLAEVETIAPWGNGIYQWQVIALNSVVKNSGGIASPKYSFTMLGTASGAASIELNADGFRINVRQNDATMTTTPFVEPAHTDVPTSTPIAPENTPEIVASVTADNINNAVEVTDIPTSTPIAPESTPEIVASVTTDNINNVVEVTDIPTNTPIAPENTSTDVPTSTPMPTDIPTSTPMPTDIPTTTPMPTDIPTTTPIPTDIPTSTPIPTDVPTNTPVPNVIVTQVGRSEDGTQAEVTFQICAATCEAVISVTDTTNNMNLVPIRQEGAMAVYILPFGNYPVLRLHSANYVANGVTINP